MMMMVVRLGAYADKEIRERVLLLVAMVAVSMKLATAW